MITSAANKNIREIIGLMKRASHRKASGCYVAEGIKMFEELPDKNIQKIYISERLHERLYSAKSNQDSKADKELKNKLDRHGFEIVKEHVFETASETKTPQGILAVAQKQEYTLDGILKKQYCAESQKNEAFKLLILDCIQDPGNLGTILRAGEGAGIDGIIISRGTVDIYSPKVTRSTMGSLFRVPFVYTENLPETLRYIKKRGIKIYAADKGEGKDYDEADFIHHSALLIGNEANGISSEALKEADCIIKIPMKGSVESLNSAIAASIIIFDVGTQRRMGW